MTAAQTSTQDAASSGRRRFLAGLVLGGLGGALSGAGGGWLAWRSQTVAGPAAPAENPLADAANATAPVASSLDHPRYMRLAIAQARLVPDLPFGAVLVDTRSGEVLAEGHNRSQESPTFHGEIDAINRLAARQTVSDWSPLALYTTAEPCPMCQSAIEWAGIGQVLYGSSIPFLQRLGWWQIDLRAEEVIRRTPFRKTALVGGVLEDECNELFLAVPRGKYRDRDGKDS